LRFDIELCPISNLQPENERRVLYIEYAARRSPQAYLKYPWPDAACQVRHSRLS